MTKDNRVRSSLLEGMRDLLNLLVHLQTVLGECGLPIIRAGGGLTFSGFSIQVAPSAPVDWIGYHIDRPEVLLYQIQDRVLPEDCPLSNVKPLQARQYERAFHLLDSFFILDESHQMTELKGFLQETIDYLRGLPPQEEAPLQGSYIPIH
jgi:hypothetical protein